MFFPFFHLHVYARGLKFYRTAITATCFVFSNQNILAFHISLYLYEQIIYISMKAIFLILFVLSFVCASVHNDLCTSAASNKFVQCG